MMDILEELDPNAVRIAIAERIAARKRAELGAVALAAAVYGSVAHGAAGPDSDVEIVLLTDDSVPPHEEFFFEDGVLVEYDCLPASRMLAGAAHVTGRWGLEADQYRHHLVLWDPDGFFPRVWTVAATVPAEAFAAALAESWWWSYEVHNKVRGALWAGDTPRAIFSGWEFAQAAALRIALHEERPYESGRTLWQDVIHRGYAMAGLVEALAAGAVGELAPAVDAVWAQVRGWGAPAGAAE